MNPLDLDLIVKIATIGIFICMIFTTIYAIKVSRQAIKTTTKESRPWVSPTKINTFLHRDMMTIKVEIQNVAKLPAFVRLDGSMKVGDLIKKVESESGVSIIMPNQVLRTSSAVKGASYREVLSNQKTLILDILVNYTDEKEKLEKYYSHVEWEFNPTLIPSSWDHITPIEMAAIWSIKSADMK